MTPEQMRAKLKEIQASLENITNAKSENGFSADQLEKINSLTSEFETIEGQLAAAEKAESVLARATASAGRKTVSSESATPSRPVVTSMKSHTDRFGGFNSSGEWLMAVKNAAKGNPDQRLLNVAQERYGEDGGFLVPEELASQVAKKLDAEDSLMSRARVVTVGGNALTLNLDETTPWAGGVRAFWTAEGDRITKSKPKYAQASWRLQKLAAFVEATDELLEDAVALESHINESAPEAIVHEVNSAIIAGDGVGKPHGFIHSGFGVEVQAEQGQSADTIEAHNILKMWSRMLPRSRSNAVWIANPACEEQLRTLVDDNNNFIYISPGSLMNQSPVPLLLGRPVLYLLGGTPALGDKGDISFVDLKAYHMIRKGTGIKSATSIHLKFDQDITSFRFTLRVDGKVPFSSPVTTQFGNYQMSSIVTLQAR